LQKTTSGKVAVAETGSTETLRAEQSILSVWLSDRLPRRSGGGRER
jgi:hypothetical protein